MMTIKMLHDYKLTTFMWHSDNNTLKKWLSCLLKHTTASNKLSLPIKITTEIPHTNLKNGPDGSTVMEEK